MSLRKPENKKLFPLDGSEIFPPESSVEYEKMQREENRDIQAYLFWLLYILAVVGILFMVVNSYNETTEVPSYIKWQK